MSNGNLIEIDDEGAAVAEPTADVSEVKDVISHLRHEGCNILAPRTYMQGEHGRKLVVQLLKFDPDRDFFTTQNGGNSPHKNPLNEIAAAMGVRWIPEHCTRIDDMKDPNFAACKAACTIPDPATGERRKHVAQYALDLRDGSERAEELSDGQLSSKRQHIAALADTGAKLRALREATGVRTDYTDSEIRQYFAIVSTIDDSGSEQLESAETAADAMYSDPQIETDADPGDPDFVDPDDALDADSRELPEPDDFPEPVDWEANPTEEREQFLEDAVRVTGYDLASKLDGTAHEGESVYDLPFEWQRKLYESIYSEHFDTVDDDVEPPPF